MHFISLQNKTKLTLLACLIAGILTTFGYAPFNLWFLSLLGLTIFFYTFAKQTSNRGAALSVFMYALTYNIGSLWWISSVLNNFGQIPLFFAGLIIFIFAGYLSILPTIAGYLTHRIFKNFPIAKNVFILPALWLLADFINGWAFTGFPWNWLGYTQIDSIFCSIAPILGVEGITLLILISCGSLGYSLSFRKFSNLIIPILLILVCAWIRTIPFSNRLTPVKVALMQGNIETETKWDPNQVRPILHTYTSMMMSNLDTQIMIWPESAIPLLENNAEYVIQDMDDILSSNKIGFITGIQYYDQITEHFYNGMIGIGYIDKANEIHYTYGEGNRYYKRHLVPIGEFVPFESIARTLGPIFNMPMSSFTKGEEDQNNIQIHGLNIASAICYEIAFNTELRKQIKQHTNMIVTVSNDGWFNNTYGPYQHLAIARMRAIEFSKPILRATNNGITAVIDEHGVLIDELPQNIKATLRSEVAPTTGTTPYAIFGRYSILVILSLILCIGLILNKKYNLKE